MVRAAVAHLSNRQRALIYRSYYLGRTTTQIAAEFRTDDNRVKHDLHRALHALRTNLQPSGDITRRR
jgi:RNA polymerase sigma-70 factor, ECF subfamily